MLSLITFFFSNVNAVAYYTCSGRMIYHLKANLMLYSGMIKTQFSNFATEALSCHIYIYNINIHRTRGKAIIRMALRTIKTRYIEKKSIPMTALRCPVIMADFIMPETQQPTIVII